MPDKPRTSQKGKSGILASEPGQREKMWKLGKDRFVRATRWMAVINDDKLDLLLLVGGEELQKLLQTLPEQPTVYQSHVEKLDQHFKANRRLRKLKGVKVKLHVDPDAKGALQNREEYLYRSKTNLMRFSTNGRKWISFKM